jgi:chromosome segregation ATPase
LKEACERLRGDCRDLKGQLGKSQEEVNALVTQQAQAETNLQSNQTRLSEALEKVCPTWLFGRLTRIGAVDQELVWM